jgi:hypothetical protein
MGTTRKTSRRRERETRAKKRDSLSFSLSSLCLLEEDEEKNVTTLATGTFLFW